MNWAQLGQFVLAVLGTLGAVEIIRAIAKRRPTKVDAADRLNEATLEWAEQLKADASGARHEAAEARSEATEARKEATSARREAAEVHRQMARIKTEAEEVAGYLAQVVRWIQSPDMSMERLRALVNQTGPLNGPGRL